MKHFMEPKSVALIGVSRQTGEYAFNILKNLLDYSYQGRIYPINPNASEIFGVKTYHAIAEVTENIDLAVISLPRSLVPSLVKKCAQKGIQSITIVTQGLGDASDEKGKQLQKQIDEIVKRNKIRILGPNTFGTANAFTNFSSSFVKLRMERLPIGVICQTGIFLINSPHMKLIGKGIDLGNACDIDFADSLEYFEQDEQTKVIALHIEGMRDGRRFLKAAKRFTLKKPLIAMKTGKGDYAARAAQSHTGSLIGSDEVWNSAFKQSGVIRVGDTEELGDAVKAFCTLPPVKGRKVGIVSFTGGFGIVAMDACQKFNLKLPEPSRSTINQLGKISPSWLRIGNPADIWPGMMIGRTYMNGLTSSLEAFLADDKIDAVLFIGGALSRRFSANLCHLCEELAKAHPYKPFVCYLYGAYYQEAKDRLEESSKTMVFPSVERAIRTLSHLADYSEFRSSF